MKIKRIPAGVYAANCFILMDEDTSEAAVIDPGGDCDDLIKAVNEIGAKVKYILLTHGHIDHTGAVIEMQKEYNVPVYINEEDYRIMEKGDYIFGNIGKTDDFLKDGSVFNIGNIEIKSIHTPGHTPGGICFLAGDVVFTGDTLFAGSIGRTDLAGGDFDTIIKSIKDKLMILEDDVTVFPGHGAQSSIGRERVNNPFL